MKTLGLSIFGTVLLWASLSLAQTQPQATISWRANTEPDIAGYRLYESQASGSYGAPKVLVQPSTTAVTVFLPSNRCNQTYFWTVTAFNTMGQESGKSIEVKKTIQGTQYWIGVCKK